MLTSRISASFQRTPIGGSPAHVPRCSIVALGKTSCRTPEAPDGRFVCHRFSLRLQYRFETHNHRCRLTPDPDASDACGWLAHP